MGIAGVSAVSSAMVCGVEAHPSAVPTATVPVVRVSLRWQHVMPIKIATKRQTLGQVLVCLGCCCGREDRGRPGIPLEWLKAEWKRGGVLKHVHLSISGCLGPCDVPNVVAIVRPEGQEWFAEIDRDEYYAVLLQWARASAEAGVLLETPALLRHKRFERFRSVTAEVVA